MYKWVNTPAPLYDLSGVKLTTIPERAIVQAEGWCELFLAGYLQVEREQVIYKTAERVYTGFVYVGFLESYIENYPAECVKIHSQTPNPNDAQQYALLYGVKQTELCGELCAAFLLGVSLEGLLAEWERDEPKIYQAVFNWLKGKRARGTGPAEIQSMLSAFEKSSTPLSAMLFDSVLNRSRYTVSGLQRLQGRAVVAVHIDKYSGRLKPSGVLHWVVVMNVYPERTGYGGVEVYNPFPNRIEVYSWDEFIKSAGVPYGVVLN